MEKGQSESRIAWFSPLDAKAICVAHDAVELNCGIIVDFEHSTEVLL